MTIAVPRGEIIEKKAGKLNYNDNLGYRLVSRGTEKMCYKTQNVKKKKLPPGLGWRQYTVSSPLKVSDKTTW